MLWSKNKAEKRDRAGMDLQGVDFRGQRGPSEKVTLEGVKKVRVLNTWGKIPSHLFFICLISKPVILTLTFLLNNCCLISYLVLHALCFMFIISLNSVLALEWVLSPLSR